MNAFAAEKIRRVDPVVAFQARCEARALLVQMGTLDFHEAVDGLQVAAVAAGLVESLGQDKVQSIMAAAFKNIGEEMSRDLQIEIAVAEFMARGLTEQPKAKKDAASSMVEALMWALREYGVDAFDRPGNRDRLAVLSPAQIDRVIERLANLRGKYPAVTDELFLIIDGVRR